MTNKKKRTLILAGIIGTLFACYKEKEKTRLHKLLHVRIGKGIRATVKQFGEPLVSEVMQTQGNAIWKDTVDHFAERKITIEASSCILSMWAKDEKALAKGFGLSASKLGKWGVPSKREDAYELESCGREVANHVWEKINELYGIEEVKKPSILDRIAQRRNNDA